LLLSSLLALPLMAEKAPYQEKVYMTVPQAIKFALPKANAVTTQNIAISNKQKKLIESRLGWKISDKDVTFYISTKKRNKKYPKGEKQFALILDEMGKHFPITFIVSIDNKGKILRTGVMVYREKIGAEVRKRRFLRQFKNKSAKDPLEVNRDIINITGATISSWSITAGVRRAIILTEELMLKR